MDEEYVNYFNLYSDDKIFGIINKNFISLQSEDIKENNQHLRRILTEGLIPIMRSTSDLFNDIYKEIKYTGSFYKGTKVSKPNEYDLDLVVKLPFNYTTVELDTKHKHCGYVKIKIGENDKLSEWERHSVILNKWMYKGYLNQNKFREWMESVMSKSFDQLVKNGRDYELMVSDKTYVLKPFSKSGPAFTLYIRLKGDHVKCEMMSVDLVPSLEFKDRLLDNYKIIPGMAPTFIVIPKPLDKVVINGNDLWRVSFYEQEKRMLSEKEFTKMKPVIRMLKKFRDKERMNQIASYFIETLCLHELMCRKSDKRFFRGPLTGLFMFMLGRLREAVCAKCLHFFWHEEHNLFSNTDENVMENYSRRIRKILLLIERKHATQSLIIAEHILTPEEFRKFRRIVSPSGCNVTEESVTGSSSPPISDPKPLATVTREPSAGSSSSETTVTESSAGNSSAETSATQEPSVSSSSRDTTVAQSSTGNSSAETTATESPAGSSNAVATVAKEPSAGSSSAVASTAKEPSAGSSAETTTEKEPSTESLGEVAAVVKEETIVAKESSAASSNAEATEAESSASNFDAKEIADELMRKHKIDDWKSSAAETIITALEEKFSPDQVEAVLHLCKNCSVARRESDRWVSLSQFMREKVFPSHTAMHSVLLAGELFDKHRKRAEDQSKNN